MPAPAILHWMLPTEAEALSEPENISDTDSSDDAQTEAEVVSDTSAEAGHVAMDAPVEAKASWDASAKDDSLVRGWTMGQGSASRDKLFALLGEVEGLLQRADLEGAEDLAAAIKRIGQAKPELADDACKLAAEAGDSLDNTVQLTRDCIKHSTLNLRRLLHF